MKIDAFFAELKRRNVYKVAVAYAVVSWLLLQAASIFFPAFDAPPWVMKIFIIVIIFGFPVALILSWAFEITPEGIKLESEIEPNKSIKRRTGRRIIAVTIALAVVAAGLFVYQLAGRDRWARRSYDQTTENGRPPATAGSLPIQDKSIAVLPFVDMSEAKDQEYFCDGISEEILDALAKVQGLRVVARTSSFSFKGKNADVGEIAQKLNVQNVLEGSLRREGNRIRITAQLINARNGFHIWSDTFERELQGVFAVQDEITRSIVDALKIKLAVAPPVRTPGSTEAYDLYLKGLYYSNKSDEENLRKSLIFFQQALDKDPNFARAWTGIAKAWEQLADAYVRPLEAYPKVKEAAWKALALDDMDAEAHCYLGEAKFLIDRDVEGGETKIKRALQLDRNSATAHFYMSWLKSVQGDCDEGVKQIQEAEKLDPLSPMIIDSAVERYLGADRLDDAISAGKRVLQVDPNYIYFDSALADAYREKGDLQEAVALYEKAQTVTHSPSAGLAITYAKMGRLEDARRVLNQRIEKSRQQYVAADSIAAVYVALGDKEEAFRWLERAFDEHSAPMYDMACHPKFRALRSDPRFADLLRRMGVDPAKALARQGIQ